MPDLKHSLHGHDLGHLRIVAERWGLMLSAPNPPKAVAELTEKLLDTSLIREVVEALPAEARAAIQTLAVNQGQLPWIQFTRSFGEVREMGSGRRDRTRPDKNPVSPAEMLWYRAIIARAFFDTPRGNQEFAYIPEDFRKSLPQSLYPNKPRSLGRPSTLSERAYLISANDQILDDICTLLAARRADLPIESKMPSDVLIFLNALLTDDGILDVNGQPNIEAARAHLEAPRAQALASIAQAWYHSAAHNDLQFVPSFKIEGVWQNNPLAARSTIIHWLAALPENTWWSLSAFVADLHQAQPDFQRPAGDYDSWYLRDVESGQFLRGFQHWDDVDGAFVRYLICGPLHWLGVMDLAAPDEQVETQVTAFRLSSWAKALLSGANPSIPEQKISVHVQSNGRIDVPRRASRSVRYQLARFCRWEKDTQHEFRYQIIPDTLSRAQEQGLHIAHLLSLLKMHAEPVPPNIIRALKSWENHGSQARLEQAMILHLGAPEILSALRKSRAARFLGDPLSPTAITIKPGAEDKVLAALIEIGYLGRIEIPIKT